MYGEDIIVSDYILGLITGLMFIIGYFVGRGSFNKDVAKEIIKQAKKPFQSDYVGAVKRPTAQELRDRNNPLLRGEKEAMREAMKDMPK